MISIRKSIPFLLSLTILASCALFVPRTVYVAPGVPMRLRQDVKNVKVWVYNAELKKWEPSVATIHNGMFVLAKKPTTPASD